MLLLINIFYPISCTGIYCESNVDIAAAINPAIKNPFIPIGKIPITTGKPFPDLKFVFREKCQ